MGLGDESESFGPCSCSLYFPFPSSSQEEGVKIVYVSQYGSETTAVFTTVGRWFRICRVSRSSIAAQATKNTYRVSIFV